MTQAHRIVFKPDLGIFTNITEFEFEQIDTRLKETAFLNAGLKIVITDNRSEDHHVSAHHYEGGLSEYVSQINSGRDILHSEVIQISGEKEIEKGQSRSTLHYNGRMHLANRFVATLISSATKTVGLTCPVFVLL